MKKYLILLFTVLTSLHVSAQSDGSQLWLGKQYANSCQVISQLPDDATAKIAKQELENNWRGKNVELKIDKALNLGEGYNIYARPAQQGDNIQYEATITASNPIGLLYGAYELIRLQNTDAYNTGSGKQQNFSKTIDETEKPQVGLRILNHWDNLDGSIERGYAGKSIFKWEEIKLGKNGKGGSISKSLHDRLITYARANASLGINGSVLNNVNASPKMMTAEYINKVKIIANILRPYGIRVYLSINFASPMALGYTKTADPLDKKVQQWWKKKAKEIYATIPDFGGFLVKANSEGQPGPGDYHRTHADGANMLADAVKPYGGIIMWRSFVYGANHKGEDRVKQAVSEFKGMDGKFRDNVILQSKNGPLDFQPREPYAPIFDNIKQTPQIAELQITQEYLGQSKHLTYLAPMWKEFFGFVNPDRLVGISGVANIGDDANWCGHPFSQANWYAFGRLAWNPSLTAEEIAHEWLVQTYENQDERFTKPVEMMMMTSREACVNYMMPLGLHHIFKFDHHYGPEPDGFIASYPLEWCPVYYHKADAQGVGFDRSSKGTDAVGQYPEPYRNLYDNIETCPEEYLLWFHHVPWTYKMKSGSTLWQELCMKYNMGVAMVEVYRDFWHTSAKQFMKGHEQEWQHTDSLLNVQLENAKEWRNTCLKYFQTFSKMKIYE
ncbi:alpha-glucuronidase [Segatella copri]|uniref:Glycosyl hydrolase family 67 middle domain protein n=1 Tax=Segatella copri DSM 18205 TaxID=537011 RepID=D1PCM2_9BACT|nr:alpha-glucuronidase [Segatella copri]EFB35674.1 glycosyl hydrolase family 67 middle domain protein [Segatella copri DSM 18205]MCW4097249.1 alpha-glucuronidase [Segatella copri]MQP19622.1 alpha-glucuronidase [Segatella copri DSM 18205]UEA43261.1 alpha-glucuronidase [Segatella copri DSM 18205]UWP52129.1 alpha-glucuronidase [Segatella copri DSM 18205]